MKSFGRKSLFARMINEEQIERTHSAVMLKSQGSSDPYFVI